MDIRLRFSLFLFLAWSVSYAQSLTTENFNHLYDPGREVSLKQVMGKRDGKMLIHYALAASSANTSRELYLLEWDKRGSFSQKQGEKIRLDSVLLSPGENKTGALAVDLQDEPWLLVATVTKVTSSQRWRYPMLIEKNYPVNGFVKENGQVVLSGYLKTNRPYTIEGPIENGPLYGYLYRQEFSSALPPFSKSKAAQDPLLMPDSSFIISSGQALRLDKEGLYLFQSDTLAAEGIAFRVAGGAFPKYTRIEDLVAPLIFISSQEEFNELLSANGDKLKFDRVILSITRDKDRAKRFMRSYYLRVELANQYFPSFKEGWKTDRGMAFIVFGFPDEVRRTGQNETWYYKSARKKFTFVKKGSVYDPAHYVLVRDEDFSEWWYTTVDLWRKSRF